MYKFEGKSIIIAAPNHYGLLQRFKENLEAMGFDTVVVPDDIPVNIGFKNKLIHILKKTFTKEKSFKREKKIEFRTQQQIDLLNKKQVSQFDYALIIRPDLFSNDLISYLKSKSNILCGYQWDGLDRFPAVYDKIDFFDRFFVFDKSDLSKNLNLLPITNFYFDDIESRENTVDVYFLGSYMKNRIDPLVNLSKKLSDLNLSLSINLSVKSSEKFEKFNSGMITLIDRPISFKTNLINASQSRIIIDFANGIHNGISMRAFESIGFQKKLITNNILIKECDFYNPNNIFVIENDNLDGIDQFIRNSYKKLDDEIYEKYSFTNWIKYVFNI